MTDTAITYASMDSLSKAQYVFTLPSPFSLSRYLTGISPQITIRSHQPLLKILIEKLSGKAFRVASPTPVPWQACPSFEVLTAPWMLG